MGVEVGGEEDGRFRVHRRGGARGIGKGRIGGKDGEGEAGEEMAIKPGRQEEEEEGVRASSRRIGRRLPDPMEPSAVALAESSVVLALCCKASISRLQCDGTSQWRVTLCCQLWWRLRLVD